MAEDGSQQLQAAEKLCGYCPNKVVKGFQCTSCEAVYHPSCSDRVKVCCNLPLKAGKSKSRKQSESNNMQSENIDFSLEAYMNLKQLLEEMKFSNGLLVQRVQSLENRLKIEMEKNEKLQGYIKKLEHKSQIEPIEISTGQKIETDNIEKPQGSKVTYANKTSQVYLTDKDVQIDGTNQNTRKSVNKQNPPIFKLHETGKIIQNINNQLLEAKQRRIMNQIINIEQDETTDGFTLASKRKRVRKQKIIGTAEDSQTEECFQKFQAINYKKPEDRKIWLFISRVKSSVDEKTVREYIAMKGSLKVDNISIKQLQARSDTNNCFMVGVPLDMKDAVYKTDFWPKGVHFQRFNFRIGGHFLSKTTQAQVSAV